MEGVALLPPVSARLPSAESAEAGEDGGGRGTPAAPFVFGSLSPWPLCSTEDLPAPSAICSSVGAEGLSEGLDPLSWPDPLPFPDPLPVLGFVLGEAPVPPFAPFPPLPPLPPLSLPKTTSEQV